MSEYDQYCRGWLPGKIPQLNTSEYAKIVGDCIYDYSMGPCPTLRESVHDEGNRKTDLGGENSLLSEDFYYFGENAIELPTALRPIMHGRGHKSTANASFKAQFIEWIRMHQSAHNKLMGEPSLKLQIRNGESCKGACAERDMRDAELDEDAKQEAGC